MVCSGYHVSGVIPSSSRVKDGPAFGLEWGEGIWGYTKLQQLQRTCWWFVVGIGFVGYVEQYQAVAGEKKDLVTVCNGYQVCRVIPSSNISKEGPAGGL